MKFELNTLYIFVGGSCDYSHAERAGGGAYIAKLNGNIVETFSCSECNTTEFRMILKSIIYAMETSNATKIEFISNVQYLINFDRLQTNSKSEKSNIDLIEKCVALKEKFQSVSVKIIPFHKSEELKQVHDMAKEAMKKSKSQKQ